eukprot:g10261.t1
MQEAEGEAAPRRARSSPSSAKTIAPVRTPDVDHEDAEKYAERVKARSKAVAQFAETLAKEYAKEKYDKRLEAWSTAREKDEESRRALAHLRESGLETKEEVKRRTEKRETAHARYAASAKTAQEKKYAAQRLELKKQYETHIEQLQKAQKDLVEKAKLFEADAVHESNALNKGRTPNKDDPQTLAVNAAEASQFKSDLDAEAAKARERLETLRKAGAEDQAGPLSKEENKMLKRLRKQSELKAKLEAIAAKCRRDKKQLELRATKEGVRDEECNATAKPTISLLQRAGKRAKARLDQQGKARKELDSLLKTYETKKEKADRSRGDGKKAWSAPLSWDTARGCALGRLLHEQHTGAQRETKNLMRKSEKLDKKAQDREDMWRALKKSKSFLEACRQARKWKSLTLEGVRKRAELQRQKTIADRIRKAVKQSAIMGGAWRWFCFDT